MLPRRKPVDLGRLDLSEDRVNHIFSSDESVIGGEEGLKAPIINIGAF